MLDTTLEKNHGGVLLDRDGTIIVDHGYVGSVDRVDFIDGAPEAIAALNRAGIPVAVVTNQAGVARGFYGIDDVEKVHEHISAALALHGAHIDLFLSCPYHVDGTVPAFSRPSFDRKPEPGMALAAAQLLQLDLSASWVVGDRPEDVGLATSVGASAILLSSEPSESAGALNFPDLASAVPFLVERLTTERVVDNIPRSHPPVTAGKFPGGWFDGVGAYLQAYFAESNERIRALDLVQVKKAAEILVSAYERSASVFACGNGGSASIANHFQCDHLKGIRNGTDLTPRVVSLSTGVELFSAIANDLGYEEVFAYQLGSQARPGDVLVVISSSGQSSNIVKALEWANANDLHTIALTGFTGGQSSSLADVVIHIESRNYGVVEDGHQAIVHALAQYIRQSRMSPDAVTETIF